MRTFIIALNILFLSFSVAAQKSESAEIKTSAECGSCKVRLEGILNYTEGVRFAELDVPTKVLTVKFMPAKIKLDEIRKIIAEAGYDADDLKANPEAQKKLPACCQPGGMEH